MAGVKYCLENKEFANKVPGVEGDIDEEKTKFSGKISRIFLGSVHDGEGTAKWWY